MTKSRILISTLSALAAFGSLAGTKVVNLRCEYLSEPIGIDAAAPRLTWEIASDRPLKSQTVEVTDARYGNPVWKSGDIGAAERCIVLQTALKSHNRYLWHVTAVDGSGKRVRSAEASFETGKMTLDGWRAVWITDSAGADFEPAPMFRKEFRLPSAVKDARVYISAAGYYELFINGRRVSDSHIDPGYTHYDERNLYATHDVTPLLVKGTNVVTAVLGNGFYNCQSKAVWDFEKARWRNRPAFIMELRGIPAGDDTPRLLLATDASWTTHTGPYTYNNIYSGDRVDNRLMPSGWQLPGFDDSGWPKARPVKAPAPLLKAQAMPAVRPVEKIRPKLVASEGDTLFVFDMGRNIAGVVSVSARAEKDTHLTVSYGELLRDGRLLQDNINVYYRPEKPGERFQTDEFTFAGNGSVESFTPAFTYHGFRYVEITADRPVKLSDSNVTGLFMHTDLAPVGSFSSSNPLLNKIHAATMLSYLGNLHSIPTDCPQREKNGWTADAHVAVDLGLLNFDGITFYEKWMNDFIDNQRPSGNISGIIPSSGWGYGEWPGPVWDAAMFIIPDALYRYYGDSRAIERLYPAMERYFEWCRGMENEKGMLTNGIGDWLSYKAQTSTHFTSSLYYYLDCRYMAGFARILGKDPEPYEKKAASLLESLNETFFDAETGLYADGTQAAQALALYAGIVPEEKRQDVARSLRDMVAANGHHLDFGLLGSKTVLRMLTRYGYVDDAYLMATRTDAPSWGYWLVDRGYTTLPETWTLGPEFHDASLNHVFMGDISAWMTNDLAGINYDPEQPGFRNVILRPHFPEGLESAEAVYNSVRGPVRSSWKRKGDKVTLKIELPAGSTGSLVLPGLERTLDSGKHVIEFRL